MVKLPCRFGRFVPAVPLSAGLLLLEIAGLPALAELDPGRWNQLDVCVTQMIDSGISSEKAGTACAGALIPKEMSSCVAKIKGGTPLDPEKALQACFRVRRPIDLANCVADIQRATLNSVPPSQEKEGTEGEMSLSEVALNSCRDSLLPGRHSECVIALSRDVKGMSPLQAMNSCLAAEDFPPDLFPAYTDN